MLEYGVRYGEHVVVDASWQCTADVMASYHGDNGYADPERRVTGVLVTRTPGDPEWRESTL